MNQIQRLIDSIRDAPHDAVIVAGMFAISALIALWIVNRMRHPERGLLHALVIASVGFVLVPCVSSAVLILWVRTGGDSMQAAFVSIFVFVFGFWGFRRWLRSAPRAARPAKALVAPAVHAAPQSGLAGEVAELRAEVARLRAVPDDLRLITLKYDSDCDACGTTLHAGEQAYWSPSARGQACAAKLGVRLAAPRHTHWLRALMTPALGRPAVTARVVRIDAWRLTPTMPGHGCAGI